MTAALRFPKPTPKKAPLEPGQHRRKYIQQKREDLSAADLARRDWCRAQPCMAGREACTRILATNDDLDPALAAALREGFGPCRGRVVPHHAGKNPGLSKKASERTVTPVCDGHHDHITGTWNGYGVFQALGKDGRRALQDRWIADACAKFAAHGGRRSA